MPFLILSVTILAVSLVLGFAIGWQAGLLAFISGMLILAFAG